MCTDHWNNCGARLCERWITPDKTKKTTPFWDGLYAQGGSRTPTAAKPLDPEAILFYILDIWLMYEEL